MINPELARAIEIFRELGWEHAPLADLNTLPLGTPAQQKQALAGLRTGEWSHWGRLESGQFGTERYIDVDDGRLAIFAVRLGVNAKRANALLPHGRTTPSAVKTAAVVGRGPAFVEQFLRAVYGTRSRQTHGDVAVLLVHEFDLEMPDSVGYVIDWTVEARLVLGITQTTLRPDELIDADLIRSRFLEHARAAAAAGSEMASWFGEALVAALTAGWIPRETALDFAVTGLDVAPRTIEQKEWVRILLDDLAITDAELVARASSLIPKLGDAPVVDALAPPLIANVGDDLLFDVASIALIARAKKSRLLVLAALERRPAPSGAGAEDLLAELRRVAGERDAAITRAAERVVTAWGADEPAPQASAPDVRGIWQATPDVWNAPRVVLPPASLEELAAAAGRLVSKRGAHDIDAEVFLDVLVRVALDDPAGARTALRGVQGRWRPGMSYLDAWMTGELEDRQDSSSDREYEIYAGAGRLPVMLSTPSWVDMRIDPDDLLERLRLYERAGVSAAENDMLLALTRLDLSMVDTAHRTAFTQSRVPVVARDGRAHRRTAGEAIVGYVDDPIVEPWVERRERDGHWQARQIVIPPSLTEFRDRPGRGVYSWHDGNAHPLWTDAVGAGFDSYPDASTGEMLRQGARRKYPYGLTVAARMVSALVQVHPKAAEDAYEGVIEAFERGLLRPEHMDSEYMEPVGLGTLAGICLELADAGLASIVWPLLDSWIMISLRGTRMLAGTADLADALAQLVPAAQAAVADGIAPASVLDLPGLRALAARPGSSSAVATARKALEGLPRMTEGAEPTEPSIPFASTPPRAAVRLEDLWPEDAGRSRRVDDGAQITAEWVDSKAPTKQLAVDLRLPDRPGLVYRAMKSHWTYDLENEGQCSATERSEGTVSNPRGDREVSLAWDGERLVPYPEREMGVLKGPLTTSLHAVVLSTLCNDGDGGLGGIRLVKTLVQRRLIGWDGMRAAIRALLDSPDVSPARMMRAMEQEPLTRSVLWPVITESLAFAAQAESLPKWTNRVLDMALVVAPLVVDAAARRWIPAAAAGFESVSEIAARKGGQAAIRKARELRDILAG